MKLNIPPVSQRNELWKDKKLGTSTVTTIGNAGCLLTCHAMMLTYYGHDFHPDDLNTFYATRKVFDQAVYINFWSASACFDDIKADEYYDCQIIPCDTSKIDEYLSKNMPVIAEVDFSTAPGLQTHFILIKGKDEAGSYICNDPWYGDEIFFQARYGDPVKSIFGLRLYSGTVKEVPQTNESLLSQINDLSNRLADEIKKNGALQNDIAQLQSNLKQQEEENHNLFLENQKAVFDKDELQRSFDALTSQYQSLLKEKEHVVELYTDLQAETVEAVRFWSLVKEVFKRILRK